MRQYLALTFDLPADLADTAAWLLHEEEAGGVEIRDHDVLPPPGMPPLPEGRAQVIGFFEGEVEGEAILSRVRTALEAEAGGGEVRSGLSRLDEQDWSQTWKLHFQPLRVGERLWVLPPWEPIPEGAVAVVIEPGMAFGTGGHATTELCLQGIVEFLRERPGASVLDVGCGSGILGIAARKLGAGRVLMIDNDEVAVRVAEENAARNGVPEIEVAGTPVGEVSDRFPLVVANILAFTLIDLRDEIAPRVEEGGELLLSGILADQAEDVVRAYEGAGLRHLQTRTLGDWALVRMGA